MKQILSKLLKSHKKEMWIRSVSNSWFGVNELVWLVVGDTGDVHHGCNKQKKKRMQTNKPLWHFIGVFHLKLLLCSPNEILLSELHFIRTCRRHRCYQPCFRAFGEYPERWQNQLLVLSLAYFFWGVEPADKYSVCHNLFISCFHLPLCTLTVFYKGRHHLKQA